MAKERDKELVLAGDIGGTKTALALFMRGKRRPLLRSFETYPSREAPDLECLIEKFLEKQSLPITRGCFGIAGPVQKGRCRTTNLPWDVYEDRIKKRFRLRHVRLINDLSAMAIAIPYLTGKEILSLNDLRPKKGQNLALIAPGTGMGQALLVFHRGEYLPIPSEGGHTDFPLNNMEDIELWEYLQKTYGHVSIERILSGPGIYNIYSWLKESGRYREPKWLAQRIKGSDPAKLIVEAALYRGQPLCRKTLDVFVSILGAVAGNLALTGLTTGGVYLGGGISPKILAKLKEDTFMNSFTAKGRFRSLMERIPVHIILNDRAALLGAAIHGFEI